MTAPYLVVGAGPTGLGCAAELATAHPVELIDRIPVPGGEAGWSTPEITALVEAARRSGVRFRLGNTAVRWEPGRLLVAGPGRIEWLPGQHLFYAGGLRPATAAHHLLTAQNRLWHRLAVIGNGPWARAVAAHARAGRSTIVGITPGCDAPEWADEAITQATQIVIVGRDRVRTVRVCAKHQWTEVACDGVVLAASPRPNRNVTGALGEASPGVTFVQPVDATSVTERSGIGRSTARRWITANDGTD
jgi:hypothetical protein